MSGAREIAKKAQYEIEELIADMLAGNHQDNEISLGLLICGKDNVQVQLKITRDTCDFLECDELYPNED